MSTDVTSSPHDAACLPDDLATCQQMLRELLVTVAQMRITIARQQERIDYLARMTFGRRSERVEGPTLFDDLPNPEPPPPAPIQEPLPEVVVQKRRGGGRRKRPDHLPRERQVLDLTEVEKSCPCCGEAR